VLGRVHFRAPWTNQRNGFLSQPCGIKLRAYSVVVRLNLVMALFRPEVYRPFKSIKLLQINCGPRVSRGPLAAQVTSLVLGTVTVLHFASLFLLERKRGKNVFTDMG
jgi:hypothetical protein